MDDVVYVYHKYAQTLRHHIECVIDAGALLGGYDIRQLCAHDASKWSAEEFNAYALKFAGGVDNPEEYRTAWLHHIHHNPHHWQHWLVPGTSEVVFMPETYALEMLADWMGASLAYTGSPNMEPWLIKNLPGITLHPQTALFVAGRLRDLGYAESVTRLLPGWNYGQ